jgi:hypothetical protein
LGCVPESLDPFEFDGSIVTWFEEKCEPIEIQREWRVPNGSIKITITNKQWLNLSGIPKVQETAYISFITFNKSLCHVIIPFSQSQNTINKIKINWNFVFHLFQFHPFLTFSFLPSNLLTNYLVISCFFLGKEMLTYKIQWSMKFCDWPLSWFLDLFAALILLTWDLWVM